MCESVIIIIIIFLLLLLLFFFFFSSRRRHTRLVSDWSSDVCSSDLGLRRQLVAQTRQFLFKARRQVEAKLDEEAGAIAPTRSSSSRVREATGKSQPKRTKTTDISGKVAHQYAKTYDLDTPLTKVRGVGPRTSKKIGRASCRERV